MSAEPTREATVKPCDFCGSVVLGHTVLECIATLRERLAAAERERDALRTALLASPDEMTTEFCKLVECVKEEMADKRELLHRLNTDPDEVKARLLASDQALFAARAEADAMRAVFDAARRYREAVDREQWDQEEIDGEGARLLDAVRALAGGTR